MLSSTVVVNEGSNNNIHKVIQRFSFVVLLQLSLRCGNKRIYHEQLSFNGGKTTNQLKPFRTHQMLKVAHERFMFLYLFFKSKEPLALVLHCVLSLSRLYGVVYFLGS